MIKSAGFLSLVHLFQEEGFLISRTTVRLIPKFSRCETFLICIILLKPTLRQFSRLPVENIHNMGRNEIPYRSQFARNCFCGFVSRTDWIRPLLICYHILNVRGADCIWAAASVQTNICLLVGLLPTS